MTLQSILDGVVVSADFSGDSGQRDGEIDVMVRISIPDPDPEFVGYEIELERTFTCETNAPSFSSGFRANARLLADQGFTRKGEFGLDLK